MLQDGHDITDGELVSTGLMFRSTIILTLRFQEKLTIWCLWVALLRG